MAGELWVDDYRPQTLEDYVCRDQHLRKKIDEWLGDGVLPHLILAGRPGTGKTSLILLLLKLLGIPSADILKIPASRNRKIDELEEQIVTFAGTWAFNDTGHKYVVLDEADSLSLLAQKMLRGEIENPGSVVRFAFTCNYVEKIVEPIRSRCQVFNFDSLDRDEFTARAGEILMRENVQFDIDVLLEHVSATYPDLRKCINLMQQDCRDGVLHPIKAEEVGAADYLIEAANLFSTGRFLEGRNLVVSSAQVEEYPEIYRYLYRNLHLWGDTPYQQDDALLAIRRGIVNHQHVFDVEINLAATIAELSRIRN